jgi:hypothetical protein
MHAFKKINSNILVVDEKIVDFVNDYIEKHYFNKHLSDSSQIYLLKNDSKELINLRYYLSFLSKLTIEEKLFVTMTKYEKFAFDSIITKKFEFTTSEYLVETLISELANIYTSNYNVKIEVEFQKLRYQTIFKTSSVKLKIVEDYNINVYEIYINTIVKHFVNFSIKNELNLSSENCSYFYFDNEILLDSVLKFIHQELIEKNKINEILDK